MPLIRPFVLAIAFVTSFYACSKKGSNQPFTVQIITEPPSLDWGVSTDSVSAEVLWNLMEGLVTFDENLRPIPGLAESWTISPDGKLYTFKIRKTAKWSDGQPVLASQFVDAWKRVLLPDTGAEYAYILYDVVNAQEVNKGKLPPESLGIRALDDSTLEIKLKGPAGYFLTLLTFWTTFPVRMDVIQKYGNAWTEPANLLTVGPYTLADWKHDASLKIRANPHYYGEKPSIKEADFLIISENSTALTLFETGKIDLLRAEIPPVDMPRFENSPRLHRHPWLRCYYYGINVKMKPFDNVKVRQAFAHAIDRNIFPQILKGGQLPLNSWIPTGMLAHDPKLGLGFDPEKAKKLLADAGFPNGKGFPSVTMMFDTREENKLIAESLQSSWKTVLNVDLRVENQEWKTYLKLLQTDKGPHLWRMGWGADYPDPDNFMNLFTSYSGNNHTKWKSPDFDRIIQVAAQTQDSQARVELYTQAQKLMLEDQAIMIPLFQQRVSALVSERVKKVSLNAMNNLYLKHWSL